MHYADIIASLAKANHTTVSVAKDHGCTSGAVSNVIHGRTTSRAIATRIATIIKKPLTEIWTDGRYEPRPARVVQSTPRMSA